MRFINLELFGHPVNILTILVIIVLFWFCAFKLSQTGALPADADAH